MGGGVIGKPPETIDERYRAQRLTSLFGDPVIAAMMKSLGEKFLGSPNVGAHIFSGPGGLPIFEVGGETGVSGLPSTLSADLVSAPVVQMDPVLAAVLAAFQSTLLSGKDYFSVETDPALPITIETEARLGPDATTGVA